MRVNELYEAVSKLGFEDSLEDNKAFYYALNRAVAQVNALRPRTAIYEFLKRPLTNLISNADFGTREVFLKAEYSATAARGYYFEVCGEGNYKIEYADEESPTGYVSIEDKSFNTNDFTPLRGIVKREGGGYPEGEVKITLYGEFAFLVKNLALYDKLYSSDETKIPAYEPYTAYDISVLASDFESLAANPIEMPEYTNLNNDYRIEDGRVILLPYHRAGVYRIRYNRAMVKIPYTLDPINDETVVELDSDLCQLLPLLIASYVWIDDDADKAGYYLTRYQELAQNVLYKARSYDPINYVTNGW